MSLFQKSVINKYLKNLDTSAAEKAFEQYKNTYTSAYIALVKSLKEEEHQDGFLRDLFVNCLGYTLKPHDNFDLVRERKNETDAKKADGAIIKDDKVIAVIELKDTKTKDMGSITDQAFGYKNSHEKCKFVVTSNFHKLRFYIDNKVDFEEFDLFELSREQFDLLYLILSKDSVFSDLPSKLKSETKFHEESISNKLYKDYSVFKRKLYDNMVTNAPAVDKLTLFKKSQKLIDRFLFILFAEDRGLLPPNSISRIISRFDILKSEDAYKPLYDICRQFFGYLNTGNEIEGIPAYNGGLFLPDDILDTLKIDDEVLRDDLYRLSTYDFDTEIDVNILGHIFEHSLSEIEEITSELEGVKTDKAKSKRKKDGVYYTPKYITQYIVENTIGTLCTEKRTELGIAQIEFDEKAYRKPNGFLTDKGKILFDKLEAYKKWLLTLKIVDPACGSGAFLNQALNFLITEHKTIDDIIAELTASPLRLFDTDKAILENNLYGVDINDESVEIAKLSLWLHTARKDRKLSDLNNNIKCGNSLINDPKVAGDKAFDWHKEFPDIMQAEGFDVVIGNPPYTYRNAITEEEKQFFKENYLSCEGNYDLYKFFIEKLSLITKNKGYSSMIVPNTFLSALTYKKLREILINEFQITELFDLGLNVFDNVVVENIVFSLRKYKNSIQITKVRIDRERLGNNLNFNHSYEVDLLKYYKIDNTFNIYLSSTIDQIISKCKIGSSELGLIAYCTVGINTGYIKEELTSNYKIDNRYHKMLNGKNIGRNFVAWNNEWIMYDPDYVKSRGEKGRSLPPEYIFLDEKILVQRTRRGMKRKLVCYYDNEQYYNLNRISNIVLKNTDFNLKYIYLILNSELLDFYFNKYFNEYEVKPAHLSKLPIKIMTKEKETTFSAKADLILDLNKQLREKLNKFHSRIKSNFSLEKISTKLESFYEHDFKTFVAELKKQKVSPTLKQQDEWEEYFNSYKKEINDLQAEIKKTDAEIDQMVYKLYELSEQEIRIVEENV
ncbi:MAG: N-6 DNA methylase [Candidatus Delongbacteria bacterium]|jgi:hypothetical protein|nr:N-6 DNA methylase [Candidatus Delongbacteria bacterium]